MTQAQTSHRIGQLLLVTVVAAYDSGAWAQMTAMHHHQGEVGDERVQGDFTVAGMATATLCHAKRCCQAGINYPDTIDLDAPTKCHSEFENECACLFFCRLQHNLAKVIADNAGPSVTPDQVSLVDIDCHGLPSNETCAEIFTANGCSAASDSFEPPSLSAPASVAGVAGSVTFDVSSDLHDAMQMHMCNASSAEFQAFEEAYKKGIASGVEGITWRNVTIDRADLMKQLGCTEEMPSMPEDIHGGMQHDMELTVPQQFCSQLENCGKGCDQSTGSHISCESLPSIEGQELRCCDERRLPPQCDPDNDPHDTCCENWQRYYIEQLRRQTAATLQAPLQTVHFSDIVCDLDRFAAAHSNGEQIMGVTSEDTHQVSNTLALNFSQDIVEKLCDPGSTEAEALTRALKTTIAERFSTTDHICHSEARYLHEDCDDGSMVLGHTIDPDNISVSLAAYIDCGTEPHHLSTNFGPSAQPKNTSGVGKGIFDAIVIILLLVTFSMVGKRYCFGRQQISYAQQKELELEQYGMVSDVEDKTLGDAASDGYNSDIDRVAYANPVSGRAEQTRGWRYHDSTGQAVKNR